MSDELPLPVIVDDWEPETVSGLPSVTTVPVATPPPPQPPTIFAHGTCKFELTGVIVLEGLLIFHCGFETCACATPMKPNPTISAGRVN